MRAMQRRLLAAMGCLVALAALVSVALAASSSGPSAASNRARARAEAARLLAMLQLPPGAMSSATEPAGDRGVLHQPGYDEATPNLVDAHGWWTVAGNAGAVLGYIAAHVPAPATLSGSAGGTAAPGFASDTFALAPIPGVLSERVLAVTVVQVSSATTAVRTDGEAVWILPRPRWERLPGGVRSVSFTASGETAGGRHGPVSVARTLTGASARRVVALINALGIVQPGVHSCPPGLPSSLTLDFAGSGGRAIARAVEEPTGCPTVALRVGGRRGPYLVDYPSVTNELERLDAIPVCSASQLLSTASLPARVGRQKQISLRFVNQSGSVCRLSGFPRIALFDAHGRRLTAKVADQGASTVRREGLGAAVALDPGQAGTSGVSWSVCAAPRATRVRITLPGVRRPFALPVGSSKRPFAPCHGRLGLSNLAGFP
jgi:hypothetical protein